MYTYKYGIQGTHLHANNVFGMQHILTSQLLRQHIICMDNIYD